MEWIQHDKILRIDTSLYTICLFRYFWQSIKQYIKFNTNDTSTETRIHKPGVSIKNRNNTIFFVIVPIDVMGKSIP